MVLEITTQEELDDIFAKNEDKLVVLDVFATWCGPCKMIAPKFAELSEKYTNVVCLKLDADKAEDLVEKYNVQAMPTFLFLKKGVEVSRVMGADGKKLEEAFIKYQ